MLSRTMAQLGRVISCGSFKFNLRDITVEPVLFLYMFAVSIVFPTLQALAYDKVCYQKYNNSFCEQLRNATFQHEHPEETDYVQSETSHWILFGNIALTVPACFTVVLFLGSFGDKVGRKFPIILPLIGAIMQAVSCLLNSVYPSAPLGLLLMGPILSGCCGGIIACLMAVFSYISHLASAESKTMRIGIVESMIFLAGTLGVFVSGMMLDRTSFTFVFSFSLCLLCLALVYTVFCLPDIKPTELVTPTKWCGRWIVDSLKEWVVILKQPRGPRVRVVLFLLILSIDLILLCTVGELDILLLFLRREPLSWPQSMYGYYKGMENLLRGLVLVTVLPLLKKKMKTRDTSLAMAGMASKSMGLILLGVANQTWIVFLSGVFGMGQGFIAAGIRSMMSSLVKKNEQGRLFSILAVSEIVVAMIAAVLFNTIYPRTLHFFPGFCFIMAAAISLVAFCIIFYMHQTGTAELCTPAPYGNMEEEEGEDNVDQFPVATIVEEEHFAYIA